MKKILMIFIVFWIAHCIAYASEDLKTNLRFGKILVKELKVQPREKAEISIPAAEDLWVGFYIDFPKKNAAAYQDKDIFMIKDKHSVIAVRSNDNGGTIISPKNGAIEIVYENLSDESFPAIIWKKEKEK
jgi:hypothetical protein